MISRSVIIVGLCSVFNILGMADTGSISQETGSSSLLQPHTPDAIIVWNVAEMRKLCNDPHNDLNDVLRIQTEICLFIAQTVSFDIAADVESHSNAFDIPIPTELNFKKIISRQHNTIHYVWKKIESGSEITGDGLESSFEDRIQVNWIYIFGQLLTRLQSNYCPIESAKMIRLFIDDVANPCLSDEEKQHYATQYPCVTTQARKQLCINTELIHTLLTTITFTNADGLRGTYVREIFKMLPETFARREPIEGLFIVTDQPTFSITKKPSYACITDMA